MNKYLLTWKINILNYVGAFIENQFLVRDNAQNKINIKSKHNDQLVILLHIFNTPKNQNILTCLTFKEMLFWGLI